MKSKFILSLFPLFLVLYEMTTYLSNDMYLPAMPFLQAEFAVSQHLLQYSLTIWFLGSASWQLLLGPLSDRFGRRPVLFLGGVLFVIANLVSATTESYIIFLIARYFQGAAVCTVVVAGYAAIHESFSHLKAIKTLAFMNSFTILAPAFGPLLGGLLLLFNSWHLIFIILAFWASISLVCLFFAMPETNPYGHKLHPLHIRTILIGYLNIILNRKFTINTISICFIFAGLIAWVTTGVFLIINVFQYSIIVYGLIQVLVFGAFILATRLVKVLTEKLGTQYTIEIGYILVSCSGVALLLTTALFPSNIFLFMLALVFYAAGTGILFSLVQRVAVESCKEPMGLRIAIFFTCIGMFCILGSILANQFFDNTSISLAKIIFVLMAISILIRYALPKEKLI